VNDLAQARQQNRLLNKNISSKLSSQIWLIKMLPFQPPFELALIFSGKGDKPYTFPDHHSVVWLASSDKNDSYHCTKRQMSANKGDYFAVIAITVGRWLSWNSVIRIFVALNPSIPRHEPWSQKDSVTWHLQVYQIRTFTKALPMKQRLNFSFLQASNATN
jgi:hypothetical protein